MVNRARINSARYLLENHPSSNNMTRCQVPSSVRAWFHDSADDIDFYQMSLSQSESTVLHESIIYRNIKGGILCLKSIVKNFLIKELLGIMHM